jgi:hypothetical protein
MRIGEETEVHKRALQIQGELLTRNGAADISQLTDRQLSAFRSQSGLQVNDPAWLLILSGWNQARCAPIVEAEKIRSTPRPNTMNVAELVGLNDENLFSLICRAQVAENVKAASALELYRRGSRFVQTPEFARLKTLCVDRELADTQAPHDPARVLDALARLRERDEERQAAIARVDRAHAAAEANLDAQHAKLETLTASALGLYMHD